MLIFIPHRQKPVIEFDGSQYYDEKQLEKDIEQTAYLERFGLKVIRIPNNYINQNFSSVCEYIDKLVIWSASKRGYSGRKGSEQYRRSDRSKGRS